MSDITELDLLASIQADYVKAQRQPGDVTVRDILATLREVDPHATYGMAEKRFRLHQEDKGLELVRILEHGRACNALRRKTPTG